MFLFSFFEVPVGVRKRLYYFRRRFFWQSDQNKRKYFLTKWNIVCRPKDQGGLGVEVLDIKNRCLLTKWIFKLLNEEGVWQELLSNKYLCGKTLAQVTPKPLDSPFWRGLLAVKQDFFSRGSFIVGNGQGTRFWEDTWLGDRPLANQFPSLFNIVRNKNVLVAEVLTNAPPVNLEFRRSLVGSKWTAWLQLVQKLMTASLTPNDDSFRWRLTSSGIFSVKSLYADYLNGHTPFLRKYIWKLKVPLKIRNFMWLVNRKVILTKDNLLKRNWNGCKKCVFCQDDETIEHLFLSCNFARKIWRLLHFTYNLLPPSSIANLFGSWLAGIDKKTKTVYALALVCALLFGLFGIAETTWFLTRLRMLTFYRLSIELLTGSLCGLSSCRKTNVLSWRLAANA